MSFATPLKTALLYLKKNLFYRTQHIMRFCNNSVNQNRLDRRTKLKEKVAKTARVQMLRAIGIVWARLWLSSDDISDHQKRRKNLIMSLRRFAAHTSSRLFLGRNVDRTRESGGNRAYQSDFSDLTLSMRRVTGSPWISNFLCWTFPEVDPRGRALDADQKERGLWGWEWYVTNTECFSLW